MFKSRLQNGDIIPWLYYPIFHGYEWGGENDECTSLDMINTNLEANGPHY